MHFELVVLATGIVPQTEGLPAALRARRVRIPQRQRRGGILRRGLRPAAGRSLLDRAGCHRRGFEGAAMRQPERVPCPVSSAFTSARAAASAKRWMPPTGQGRHRRIQSARLPDARRAVRREGCGLIRQDLAAGAVETVVVAACSPRFKAEAFNFNHGSVLERVNLREHVAWCHKPKDEDTQMLAEDYLRMGIAQGAQDRTAPSRWPTRFRKTLLVVGGGITGITAALEAAAAGYAVVLVEKEEELGGARGRSCPGGQAHRYGGAHRIGALQPAHPDLLLHPGCRRSRASRECST